MSAASTERALADTQRRKSKLRKLRKFLSGRTRERVMPDDDNSGSGTAPATSGGSAHGTGPGPPLSSFAVDRGMTDESINDWWKRCSGLHTVEEWVRNYQKHPAGWAVLLAIHGIPEVTGRLRSKVESYAIYSALFLSFSIPAAMDLPEIFRDKECEQDTSQLWGWDWECELRKRAFLYLLYFGIAQHMLSIVLAMAFVNALNEACRDSDVFRMFARGQGFLATVKVQNAFRYGAAANFIAIAVVGQLYVGAWEPFVLWLFLWLHCYRIYKPTAHLLFSNASCVDYWRSELGGKPDSDDPYDLRISMELFSARAAQGRQMATMDVFDNATTDALSAAASAGAATPGGGVGAGGVLERRAVQGEVARQQTKVDENVEGVAGDEELEAFLDLLEEEAESEEKGEPAAQHGETLDRHENAAALRYHLASEHRTTHQHGTARSMI